jgi:hypothetical protein
LAAGIEAGSCECQVSTGILSISRVAGRPTPAGMTIARMALGLQSKLIQQCGVEPDLDTIAIVEIASISQDFLAGGNGGV